jgi:4-amino-4-deoxy-L-arabinose transferase-like glycosyltransferase
MRKKLIIPPEAHGIRYGLLSIFLCLALHILLAIQLELSVDEAHYALYAVYPALSYFDHPPLVGWVQIPFLWMGGADWMMRIVPLVLWGLTAFMLRRFSNWALTLFLLSITHHLLGLALLPDTLLFPLTLWVMALTHRLMQNPSNMPNWLLLGVALGVAGLSKYTGVSLALGVALVLLPKHGTALFRQRGLWCALLIAGVMILPVIVWNAQHDWVSFTYQLNHAGGDANQGWKPRGVVVYIGLQILAYGLLPPIGLVIFYWRLRTRHADVARICLAFGLPLLILMILLAGKGASMPHWTTAAWIALFPAAALGLQHAWQSGVGISQKAIRLMMAGLMSFQALAAVVVMFAMFTGGTPLGSPGNPFADFYDWKAASSKAHMLQEKYHADALAVSNWTLASRLAWYARTAKGSPESAVKVLALDGKNKQFEMWFGSLEYGQSYLWVNWSQRPLLQPVGCRQLVGDEASYLGQHSRFDFYLCGRP